LDYETMFLIDDILRERRDLLWSSSVWYMVWGSDEEVLR
jgi:hypothetical protein